MEQATHRQYLIGACGLIVLFAALINSVGATAGTFTDSRNVFVSKTASVRISNLSDIVFPPSTNAPTSMEISICVYSNSAGDFDVTATSQNAASGGMNLRSGSRDIHYIAEWASGSDRGQGILLQSGVTSKTLTGADQSSPSCNSGPNARLRITLDPVSYAQAPVGNYADILSLTIAPN